MQYSHPNPCKPLSQARCTTHVLSNQKNNTFLGVHGMLRSPWSPPLEQAPRLGILVGVRDSYFPTGPNAYRG